MGTRGLKGYIHKGQKYVRYIHHDSYPDHVGKKLVSRIPSDPEEFQCWLEKTRALLEKVEVEAKKGCDPWVLSRTSRPILTNDDIEWTYVYDLDRLSFTVNGSMHFRLDNLPPPDEWLSYIALDGSQEFCVAPWMPEQYRAELVAYPVRGPSDHERKDMEYYDAMASRIEKILPSEWLSPVPENLVIHEKLALLAAEGFMTKMYAQVNGAHRYFSNNVFEDLAKDLLTAACHGSSTFTLDYKTWCAWTRNVSLKELRASVRKRIDYFWFRDRLISLVRTLEDAEHFKADVGIILRWMKEKGLSELTSILWSIHHVAVLVVSGDKVSHSDPIPVAAALGRDREKMTEGLKLIMHYLPLRATEGNTSSNRRIPLDVFLRIMDFSDPETKTTLGQTSKILRYAWARHPYFGPYQLLSIQGDQFLAIDEVGRHITVKLEPNECESYEGHYEKRPYDELEFLAAYRKPTYFVKTFHWKDWDPPLSVDYRVFVGAYSPSPIL